MGVTVNVNGLSLCHKGSNGVVTATVPDVCKTPSPGGPIPIPYPNIAFSKDLAKGSTSVQADGDNSCAIKGSEFAVSVGDEPGTLGGVKSGVNKSKATWITWSFDVKIEGKNACRLTDKMLMNKGNTVSMGGECQPPLSPDQLRDKICELACECYSIGKGQQCLNEKLEEEFYDREYPASDSPVWREVSMRRTDGAWQIIMNRAGDAPTSNPFTPRGGIRPDCVAVDNGTPSRIFEVKFPGDSFRPSQDPSNPFSAYNEAARDQGIEYETIDDCSCFGGPPGEPVPVTNPEPQEQDDGISLGEAALGVVVAVGVVALFATGIGEVGAGLAAIAGLTMAAS